MIQIKSKAEIEKMRKACKMAAELLTAVGEKVDRGISTLELNDYAVELMDRWGVKSAPYLYQPSPSDTPFPKHLCTSVNSVVCHGIPRADEYLKKGDIINIDVTVIVDGFHGDTSRTFFVGKPKPEALHLVTTTEKAMYVGIEAIKPGGCVSDIGLKISEFIKPHGYSIVEELTGHGIGREFHEDPAIFHFFNPKYRRRLSPGMIFTCEPMINQGKKDVQLLNDGWTIVTADGKLSAQFEHTVLVTETGYEILTRI